MRLKILAVVFFSIIYFSINTLAQKRVDESLDALLQSEFIAKFQEMRVSAVSTATSFKNQQNNYPPEAAQRVEVAYNEIAEKFNFVLLGLKNDLLDRKKLKFILAYPEDYQKQLELDMYKLSDFYAQNYQQVLAEVTNNQVDGSAVLFAINNLVNSSIGIFQLVKSIINYAAYRKKIARQFSETELEKRLIKPHQFPKWNELGVQQNDYNNGYNSGGGYNNEVMPPQDNINFNYSSPTANDLIMMEELKRSRKESEEQDFFQDNSELDFPLPEDDPLNGTGNSDLQDDSTTKNNLNNQSKSFGKPASFRASNTQRDTGKSERLIIPIPAKKRVHKKDN